MLPDSCSFVFDKNKCILPPEFIIEINDESNDTFMIGLACFDHKQRLEKKFRILQMKNKIPNGKIEFKSIKTIHTNCIKGNIDDVEDIQLKRL
ncbi:MAG TPA: hypothetical protein VIY08_14820 [Candidatus Nitrosocosmicus sp.]